MSTCHSWSCLLLCAEWHRKQGRERDKKKERAKSSDVLSQSRGTPCRKPQRSLSSMHSKRNPGARAGGARASQERRRAIRGLQARGLEAVFCDDRRAGPARGRAGGGGGGPARAAAAGGRRGSCPQAGGGGGAQTRTAGGRGGAQARTAAGRGGAQARQARGRRGAAAGAWLLHSWPQFRVARLGPDFFWTELGCRCHITSVRRSMRCVSWRVLWCAACSIV